MAALIANALQVSIDDPGEHLPAKEKDALLTTVDHFIKAAKISLYKKAAGFTPTTLIS